jgi:hypothetical protein
MYKKLPCVTLILFLHLSAKKWTATITARCLCPRNLNQLRPLVSVTRFFTSGIFLGLTSGPLIILLKLFRNVLKIREGNKGCTTGVYDTDGKW